MKSTPVLGGLQLPAPDGHAIDIYAWLPETPPRAIVQIAHGMGEHAQRYAATAEALVAAGHAVYANDHRGHGRRAFEAQQLGKFGEAGFSAVAADMALLTRHLRTLHAGRRVVLLGHSMGSFAAQDYVLDHSALLDGLVLSGSAALDQRIAAMKLDPTLRVANASFEPSRTPFDWLSRDDAAVDAYVADPLCGFSLDADGMRSMGSVARRLADPAERRRIRADLPVWLFTGDHDPINGHLKWFDALATRYRDAGLKDVTATVYPGGRHEMLNETNRDEVIADLLAWLERVAAR
jgi:alpha-beta hydrolase superfamily lysophospholipase